MDEDLQLTTPQKNKNTGFLAKISTKEAELAYKKGTPAWRHLKTLVTVSVPKQNCKS